MADFLYIQMKMARWLSWLERRPVTAEVVGSNPIRVVILYPAVRPLNRRVCGYGGIGRHKRLKISREQSRAGSSPATRTID